jgi:zinc transporter, ZIP family
MDLLILSSLTGLMIFLGALGVLMFGEPGKKILAFYLGMATGVMMLVILVDLLPAAFAQGPKEAVGIGLGCGIFVMMLSHRLLSSLVGEGVVSVSPKIKEYFRIGWMIALAVALHNVPEGIAIGAGFEAHQDLGVLVALSIALHNVPAGIGMAIPFVMAKVRGKWILTITFCVSLCIPLGAWLGQLFFVGSSFMVSMGIAFASGAMGYIVWKEIAPTSFRHDRLAAQLGVGASIILMYIVHVLR